MPSLDMDGPFQLTRAEIERVVARAGPGNFALGQMAKDGKRFVVREVGRDDADVRRALLAALGQAARPGLLDRLMGAERGPDAFKFSYAQDPTAAYEKHCRTYHGFNSQATLTSGHPRPPAGAVAKCPICGET